MEFDGDRGAGDGSKCRPGDLLQLLCVGFPGMRHWDVTWLSLLLSLSLGLLPSLRGINWSTV